MSHAENLANQPYNPYSGPRVADFSNLQNTGFDVAAGGVAQDNPYYQTSADYINNYATGASPNVTPNTISSQMSPYMNQFVGMALAPQVEAQNQQFAAQNRNLDAAATSSGAYGDARAGIEAANLTNQQNIARQGLIGSAYTNAFNTAIGAGAQDVGNQLQSGMFNAQMQQAGLGRQLTGAQALQQLYGTNLADIANRYGLSAQAGGQQQQQAQAQLNVPYSNYLAAQQWPFLTAQNLNQAIGAGTGVFKPAEQQVTSAPDNSGYAMLGGIGGAILSDKREKTDIEEIGKLKDGQIIYKYRYKGDDSREVHIGLMAQEVEKKHPDSVVQFKGRKYVDQDKATAFAAAIGDDDEDIRKAA